jgi:hypothetical protein
MAIMSAPRGTDYILLYISLSLPINFQTPPATAPAFTILHRLISRLGDPYHTIKFSLPTPCRNYSCSVEPRRLKSTIKISTPHLCTSPSNSTQFPRSQIPDTTFKHEILPFRRRNRCCQVRPVHRDLHMSVIATGITRIFDRRQEVISNLLITYYM